MVADFFLEVFNIVERPDPDRVQEQFFELEKVSTGEDFPVEGHGARLEVETRKLERFFDVRSLLLRRAGITALVQNYRLIFVIKVQLVVNVYNGPLDFLIAFLHGPEVDVLAVDLHLHVELVTQQLLFKLRNQNVSYSIRLLRLLLQAYFEFFDLGIYFSKLNVEVTVEPAYLPEHGVHVLFVGLLDLVGLLEFIAHQPVQLGLHLTDMVQLPLCVAFTQPNRLF